MMAQQPRVATSLEWQRSCCKRNPGLYTHCYGHALYLACGDTIKKCKVMNDALDTTHEITKLIKKSAKRGAIFERLKAEMAPDTPGVRVLCPTRWTIRAEALQRMLNNYEVLQDLWIESLDAKLTYKVLHYK